MEAWKVVGCGVGRGVWILGVGFPGGGRGWGGLIAVPQLEFLFDG